MKHLARALLICAAWSCGPTAPPPVHPAGPAVCDQGPASPMAVVTGDTHVVGATLSVLRRYGDEVWVVESGANTVSVLERGGELAVRTDVGNERGPTDVWVDGDQIWITNFVANSVTVADRTTGRVVAEIDHESIEAPAGIAGTDRWVFVGNTEFRGDEDYGPGSLTIIDRRTLEVVGTRQTAAPNPQYLRAVDGQIIVVDSGSLSFEEGRFIPASDAAVERLDGVGDDPVRAPADVLVLPAIDDVGSPGFPAFDPDSRRIFLASGTTPTVFAIDLDRWEWTHGSADPIRLYESNENALHDARMGPHGILFVTAFNRDEIYLVDTRCDAVLGEPIVVDTTELLAGPLGVVPFETPDGIQAWVGMSLANELRSIQLHLLQ